MSTIYQKIKSSVVAIGRSALDKKDGSAELEIFGSAFCVDKEGMILTCEHVIRGHLLNFSDFEERFKEVLSNEVDEEPKKFRFEIAEQPHAFFFLEIKNRWAFIQKTFNLAIGDFKVDIAVVKLLQGPFIPQIELDDYPVLELGDSDNVEEGEEIIVCGFPFGSILHKAMGSATSSFHDGIISAILPTHVAPSKLRSLFQLDVMALPGNSGGPVISKRSGKVIGVVQSYFPFAGTREENNHQIHSGLSFAVPINKCKELIKKGKKITDEDIKG